MAKELREAKKLRHHFSNMDFRDDCFVSEEDAEAIIAVCDALLSLKTEYELRQSYSGPDPDAGGTAMLKAILDKLS